MDVAFEGKHLGEEAVGGEAFFPVIAGGDRLRVFLKGKLADSQTVVTVCQIDAGGVVLDEGLDGLLGFGVTVGVIPIEEP